ncbi:MAG: CBS domain-containing protein [Haloarculaceae archaeon]
MLVADVMSTDLVTCPRESTLQVAVERMLAAGVGSVVVTVEGNPHGIVTETDALAAGAESGRPFAEIPVAAVVSHPLISIAPDATLRSAVAKMEAEGVKKLAVVDGIDLAGLLTRTDVVAHYTDIVSEAHAIDDQRERWEADRFDPEAF